MCFDMKMSVNCGLRIFVVLSFVFFLASFAFAAVEEVACNNYYHFDGLQFREFAPEKVEYVQGDDVRFNYVIENVFGSPLVQGDVKVLIMYEGPEVVNRMEDPDLLDDLFAETDVNIQEGDKYAGSFAWKIPKKAKPGVYVAKVYFPVKRKLNIAGLTFMSSVPAKSTTFKVLGTDSGVFLLEKNRTLFNGQKYGFRDYIPGLQPGESAEVKTFLSNPNRESVTVVYELFYWDDTETRMDSYTKTETVTDSRDLSYSLPALPVGVYLARITASAGDWKSILKVRFYVEGAKAKFVWLGLDRFPLMKDDEATVAFCFSNSAVKPRNEEIKLPVKINIEVLDEAGGKVFEEEHQVYNLTANIVGRKMSFAAPKQYTKLKLLGSIYGVNGELMDEIELVYDYSKFLNIEKTFRLLAPERAVENLAYEVEYVDKYGDGIDGEAVVYLSASDGKVVAMKEDRISGRMTGQFSLTGLPEGVYTIKAVEKKETLSDKKTVTVSRAAHVTTTPPTTGETTPPTEEKKPGGLPLQTIALAAVLILIIAAAYLKLKPKRRSEKLGG